MKKEPFYIKDKTRGLSLVEVVLSSALFLLIVTGLSGVLLYGQESTRTGGALSRAAFVSEEGLEALRNIRDSGFSNLVQTSGSGLSSVGGQWSISGSPSDTTDIFSREVEISPIDLYRNLTVSNVSWWQNGQRTGLASVMSYLTDWRRTGTVVGDWSSPSIEATIHIPGSQSNQQVGVSGDYAYVVRDGGSPNFLVYDISTLASPSLAGSLVLPGIPTNIVVSGSYAYVTSENDAEELQIVDISNPNSPSIAGTYNASGSENANGIFAVGSLVYLVRTNNSTSSGNFLIIDTSNPASPSLVSSLDTSGTSYEVAVSGPYAYVASGDNNQELKVIGVSDPFNPFLAGGLDLAGSQDSPALALSGSTLFIAQYPSLKIVNIGTPASPSLTSSYSVGGTVNDIAFTFATSKKYIFLATNVLNQQFQVIDATAPSAPVLLSSHVIAQGNQLISLFYDQLRDRVFTTGQANTPAEFVIFKPQ